MFLVRQLAAHGHPDGLFVLGRHLWSGGLVTSDPVAAREQFDRAARAGHGPARILSTNLLASGIAGPRNWLTALSRMSDERAIDPRRKLQIELLSRMTLNSAGQPERLRKPERLSDLPDAQLFPGFATAAECAYLLELGSRNYRPAEINDGRGGTRLDPIRNSDEFTIHWLIEDPVVHAINRRIAAVAASEADRGEAMQLLRYRPGQRYRAHYDYNPGLDNQRELTALIYLNHDYKGGETSFIKTALKVKGRKGDLLLFRNTLSDGSVDPMSEHEGSSIISGTKYLASRWIRERRFAP
ncbi:Peptidyl prolyl 4-hydroxylase, alpha subunit [Sphingopyxis granuli]|uniref:Peptidyl prolyl 4-hydroxylase, alpha subunit n=2 Tax=Sphingopyxis granuli TaxID=267128 RepID=A0AA86GKJ2_9SPHN|nr:Peptidyl prolyl 4-hydroxylase, alpha subunit [Sphingopyxis granuli]